MCLKQLKTPPITFVQKSGIPKKKKLRNEGHPLLPPASTHDSNCSILKYSSTPPQFFDVIFILNRENRQTHKKEVELLNFKIFLEPLQN